MSTMPPPASPTAAMPPGARPEKASGMAVASLVLSLVGICCTITAVVGLILGLIELGKIKKGESSAKGKGMATAGVIIGAIAIGLGVLWTIYSMATGGFYWNIEY